MADLQSKPLIELNLDTREITITNNIKYIDIDKNIANIFLQIYRRDNTGLKTYLTKEELDSFVGKMFLIKPVTNDFTEITGINTKEFESDNGGGVLRFIIPTKCTNKNGIVKCEIHINKDNELLASDRFVYNVKQSLVTEFDDSLLDDKDFPVLQQLILEIQKASNIDDVNISKITTYSSDKINSQIKDKASKQEVDVERKRIDNLTTLPEGSTTGDAELIDGRVDIEGKIHTNIGEAIRTQVKDINNILTQVEKAVDNGVFDIKNMYEWEFGYINASGEYIDVNYMKRVTKSKFIPFNRVDIVMDGSQYNLHVIEYDSDGTFIKNTDYINKNNFSLEINENHKYAFCLQYRRDNVTVPDLSILSITANLNNNSKINENKNKIDCVNIKPKIQFKINASANNYLQSTVCKYTINEDNSYNLNMISGHGDTYSLYNFSLNSSYSNISKNKYLIEIENLGNVDIDFSNTQNKFILSNKKDFSGTSFHLKKLMDNQILCVGEIKHILIDLNSEDIKNLFIEDSSNLYFVFGYHAQLKNDRSFKLSFIDFTDYTRKGVVVADYLDNFDVDEYLKLKDTVKNINDKLPTLNVEDKKIICCGDSLTMGAGGEDSSPDGVIRGYPEFIQEFTGITTINTGIGGDRCQEIYARLGSEPLVVNNITIPSDKTPVELGFPLTTILGREFRSDLKYNASKVHKINPVTINGIVGEITQPNGIGTSYYFTRKEAGEQIIINRPTIITTTQMSSLRNPDDIYVFYVGQNGGYDGVEDWIQQIKAGIDFVGCDKYLVIVCQTNYHNDTWDQNYAKFKNEFKGRFLDIRSYILQYGLEDNGLTATSDDTEAITNGVIPPSLKKAGDSVHFNYYGYKTIGKIASQRLKELYPNYFN